MIRPSVTEEQVFHESFTVNFCGEGGARGSYEIQPIPERTIAHFLAGAHTLVEILGREVSAVRIRRSMLEVIASCSE